MIVPDANVLLYALNDQLPSHKAAKSWLEKTLSGTETVGFTWLVLLAVIRISTRAAIFMTPLSVGQALDLVQSWLDQPNAIILEPTDMHISILRDLLVPLGAGGNLTSDAHLAAIAIEHGATLVSYDRDFGRFPGVRHVVPAG